MKEEIVNERQCETEDEKIDIQQLLFKYIIHWPWFVGAVLVCLIGAWIYLRMATPVYNISATVLIKDDKKRWQYRKYGRTGRIRVKWLD